VAEASQSSETTQAQSSVCVVPAERLLLRAPLAVTASTDQHRPATSRQCRLRRKSSVISSRGSSLSLSSLFRITGLPRTDRLCDSATEKPRCIPRLPRAEAGQSAADAGWPKPRGLGRNSPPERRRPLKGHPVVSSIHSHPPPSHSFNLDQRQEAAGALRWQDLINLRAAIATLQARVLVSLRPSVLDPSREGHPRRRAQAGVEGVRPADRKVMDDRRSRRRRQLGPLPTGNAEREGCWPTL